PDLDELELVLRAVECAEEAVDAVTRVAVDAVDTPLAQTLQDEIGNQLGHGLPFGWDCDLAAQAPQLKNVRPVVMPRRVEALALFVEPLRVELRVEDPLLVPERAGEVGAVRAENRRAAAAEELVS